MGQAIRVDGLDGDWNNDKDETTGSECRCKKHGGRMFRVRDAKDKVARWDVICTAYVEPNL